VVPSEDIDRFDNTSIGELTDTTRSCVFLVTRTYNIKDDVDEDAQGKGLNSWSAVKPAYMSKADFIQSFFEPYRNAAGEKVYPEVKVDYGQFFKTRGDMWADGLEYHLAFRAIGTHRTMKLPTPRSHGGETVVYHSNMLGFGTDALKRRDPAFSRWGGEMGFSAEGMPLMVKLPSGDEVWKHTASAEEWQYAKFAWRATLINGVTLVDHLWFCHFIVANDMAIAARETLPPHHPLRRISAMFTWGTPQVNEAAVHQLAGARALLHRMTPFEDFGAVSKAAVASILPIWTYCDAFINQTTYDALPKLLRESPFYVDGRDFYNVLSGFIDEFFDAFEMEWCTADGHVRDEHVVAFLDAYPKAVNGPDGRQVNLMELWLGIVGESMTSKWQKYRCDGLRKGMKVLYFIVTGLHRHMGHVADLMRDPELTSPSWLEGQRSGQPRQALQAALIAATTGYTNPKLGKNSWGFMFEGMEEASRIQKATANFEANLDNLKKVIDNRNLGRKIPYFDMHPDFVDCSVAV